MDLVVARGAGKDDRISKLLKALEDVQNGLDGYDDDDAVQDDSPDGAEAELRSLRF